MNKICVFCGSSVGNDPMYTEAARKLGKLMAENNIGLVYGGGGIGLMGEIANAVMSNNGQVIGVIPRFLAEKELGHQQISELILTDSMHQRKQKMAELADGFIALPGGFGTLEELCEILTWVQLSIIEKPVAILNTNGFFDHLILLFEHMVNNGFLRESNRDILLQAKTPQEIIKIMKKNAKIERRDLGLT
ncbi:MAG: TIGR00730 family Rossman fold protein [Cyclobacteriaceae bacterium]